MKFSLKFSIEVTRSNALEKALSQIDISEIDDVVQDDVDSEEPFGFAGTYLREGGQIR